LQSEQRAAVEYQIEFDIAAAAVSLKIALSLAIGVILAALQNRHIGIQKSVAQTARHGKSMFEAALGKVIKKYAAHSAWLVTVFEKEITVTPFFEARVQVRPKRIECVLTGGMEVACVVFKAIVRREIHAATEPPNGRFARLHRNKTAHIQMDGRGVGIAGMQDQRNPHGLPAASGELGAVSAGGRWQLVTKYMREIHAAALQHVPLLD